MMVQKLHWKGQPRPASKEVMVPAVRRALLLAMLSLVTSIRCLFCQNGLCGLDL